MSKRQLVRYTDRIPTAFQKQSPSVLYVFEEMFNDSFGIKRLCGVRGNAVDGNFTM